jgi:general secretion pathway protein A
MASHAATEETGLLVYEPFYGLDQKPFSLSTDPLFLYKSASHRPVFDALLAGIRRREGLVILTGEIGMGKTTLCRSVLGTLDRKTFAAFVPDPFVSREDLLKILLVEFGVVAVDDIVRGRLRGASRAELSYTLYEFLRSLEPLDAFAVVLLDEAQNLAMSLLEEVRILADLEGARRLLQVVLIGQPELSTALKQPHMRQLRQRVTTHCELQPLDREGLYGYVGHRLTVAGATPGRLRVTGDALDLVFDATGGVPRVVNRLCDRTLQHGHLARAATIGPELVRLAAADLQLMLPERPPIAFPPPADPAPAPPAAIEIADTISDRDVPDGPAPDAVSDGEATDNTAVSEPAPPAPAIPREVHDLLALLERPPLVTLPAIAGPSPQIEAATAQARRDAVLFRRPQEEQAHRGSRIAAAAGALLVLGGLSGVSLAAYWMWAAPLVSGLAQLPHVERPAVRIAAPLPRVLPPVIESLGDALAQPPVVPPERDTAEAPEEGAGPVAASESLWVVQVGAFSDESRASALTQQLIARGFTAFTSADAPRNGVPRQLVLAGPYDTRRAAARALDRVEEIEGIGRPILRPVPPAIR